MLPSNGSRIGLSGKNSSANAGLRIRLPGACLLGIWPVVAALLLYFNVYYLRRRHPGQVSGKLSDFAINFLLPVALFAGMEWTLGLIQLLRRRPFSPLRRRAGILACAVSATYFSLLKLVPQFTQVHRALIALLTAPFGGDRRFHNIADPTDLVALTVVPFAFAYLAQTASVPVRPRFCIVGALMIACATIGVNLSREIEPGIIVQSIHIDRAPALHFLPRGKRCGTALLVHGIPSNKHMVFRIAEALAAAGFEVVTVDLPGNGDSMLPLSYIGAKKTLGAAARYLGGNSVDVVIGHSLGATLAGQAIFAGELRSRALFAFGALPEIGSRTATRLWYFGGQFDELVRLQDAEAWAKRTRAVVVTTSFADHPLALFSPYLVEQAVRAASFVVGAAISEPARYWRWRLVGACLLAIAALLAIRSLAQALPAISLWRAIGYGVACAAIVLCAAQFAAWSWLAGMPTWPRVLFAMLVMVPAAGGSWLLGALAKRFKSKWPAAGLWAVVMMLPIVALATKVIGAPFVALVATVMTPVTAIAASLGTLVEKRAGQPVAAHLCFAIVIGWVLGMWCPLVWIPGS